MGAAPEPDAVSQCSYCWTDSDSFEPRDAVKRDVARMLVYAIRYEGATASRTFELNNSINGSTPWHGAITVPQPVHRPPGVGRVDLVRFGW